MMKTRLFLLWMCGLLCLAACKDEEPYFSLSVESVTLEAEAGARAEFTFTSTLGWEAAVPSGGWFTVSQSSGGGGTFTLTLTARSTNEDVDARSASLTLTSGSLMQQVKVTQEASSYAAFEQDVYEVPQEGGSLKVFFVTNLEESAFNIYASESWLGSGEQTRALTSYYVPFSIPANTSRQPRSANLYIMEVLENGEELLLATTVIRQVGVSAGGESTDYSRDGEVRTIQLHTQGNGIPIVMMGDGFRDVDIEDGLYDQAIDQAVENLFTEEPFASLRDYFDIYAVTAVSRHNAFGTDYETAFSCWLEGGGSTLVEGDDVAVQTYTQMVDGVNLYEALSVVVLNTTEYAGTTYFGYGNTQTNELYEYAIAFCPIIESLDSEFFREVMVHEAVGHGFAKLDDEYDYEGSGTIPADVVEQNRYLQSYGWFQNVDFTDDWNTVLWARFLADERYDGQGLGVFEGAGTYSFGAYRPTEDSMMRNNRLGFNAPSRFAIYTRVIESGEGRTPDYEEFVAFDQQTYTPSVTRSVEKPSWRKPFARPRFVSAWKK